MAVVLREVWNSIDRLSTVITWSTGIVVAVSFVFGLIAVIADRRREKLQNDVDLAREEQISDTRRKTEELRQQNLRVETTLEAEGTTRLGLEGSLAPRAVEVIWDGGLSNLDGLKRCAGR